MHRRNKYLPGGKRKLNVGLLWLLVLAVDLVAGGCMVSRHGRAHHGCDMDSVAVSDKVSVHDTLLKTDSVWTHDTMVGMAGGEVTAVLHDTIIRSGPMRLLIRGNIIDCKWDSLTLVIRNLTQSRSSQLQKDDRYDSLSQSRHEVKTEPSDRAKKMVQPGRRFSPQHLVSDRSGLDDPLAHR